MSKSVRDLYEPGTKFKFQSSPVKKRLTMRRMGKNPHAKQSESTTYDVGTRVKL